MYTYLRVTAAATHVPPILRYIFHHLIPPRHSSSLVSYSSTIQTLS